MDRQTFIHLLSLFLLTKLPLDALKKVLVRAIDALKGKYPDECVLNPDQLTLFDEVMKLAPPEEDKGFVQLVNFDEVKIGQHFRMIQRGDGTLIYIKVCMLEAKGLDHPGRIFPAGDQLCRIVEN